MACLTLPSLKPGLPEIHHGTPLFGHRPFCCLIRILLPAVPTLSTGWRLFSRGGHTLSLGAQPWARAHHSVPSPCLLLCLGSSHHLQGDAHCLLVFGLPQDVSSPRTGTVSVLFILFPVLSTVPGTQYVPERGQKAECWLP